MKEFLVQNWERLMIPLTGIVAYFFSKRKYQKRDLAKSDAQIESQNLENLSKNFQVYQDLVDDLEIRFKKRIEELEVDLIRMKTLNTELRQAVARQEKYINKLIIKIESYESNQKNK
jgi:IS1 family transposase